MTNHFIRGSRGASGAAASPSGASTGVSTPSATCSSGATSGSSSRKTDLMISSTFSSITRGSPWEWGLRPHQHALEQPAEEHVPSTEIERHGKEDGNDDDGHRDEFLAAGPVHSGQFGAHLTQEAPYTLDQGGTLPGRDRAAHRSCHLHISRPGHEYPHKKKKTLRPHQIIGGASCRVNE